MSALSDYLAAIKHQAALLNEATEMDEFALYMPHNPRPSAVRASGAWRPWTRQDKRRAEWSEFRDEQNRQIEAGTLTQWEAIQAGKAPGRIDTRAYRVVRRWPAPDHRSALAEAQAAGSYSIVAPLILRLVKVHNRIREWHVGETEIPSSAFGLREKLIEELSLHLPPDETRPPPPPPILAPSWNGGRGELSYGGSVVKRIQNIGQAKNVVRILDAFEEDGWPERIDDPLPGGKNSGRLKAAIESLNNNLAVVQFSRDGTGQGIRWNA